NLDGADDSVLSILMLNFCTRQAFRDQPTTETLALRLFDGRSVALLPHNGQNPLTVPFGQAPVELNMAGRNRERAVFCRVRRELVQHKTEGNCLVGSQSNGRPADANAVGAFSYVRLQLAADEKSDVRSTPVRFEQKSVSAGERVDAAIEP